MLNFVKCVEIYTDGACSGNPGPGGWAAILMYSERVKEISGFEKSTTNNRMELLAIIKGLQELKASCNVNLYSDSAYAVNAFNQNWIIGWQKNGWRTASKGEVKNIDLWQELLRLTAVHNVTFIKVKGHSDNMYNNRCDELATGQIRLNY